MDQIQKLLSQDNTENITLYDENDVATEFEQVAVIPCGERIFAILKPVSALKGVGEDEALVFTVEEIDDEDCLVIVDDQQIVDKVFEAYYALLQDEGII